MERAANRLPAYQECSLFEKLQGQELAAPARTQATALGGQHPFCEILKQFPYRALHQRHWTSPSAIMESPLSLPEETTDDSVDGGARTVEDTGDLGGRVTL
jgi:hypothetical protein